MLQRRVVDAADAIFNVVLVRVIFPEREPETGAAHATAFATNAPQARSASRFSESRYRSGVSRVARESQGRFAVTEHGVGDVRRHAQARRIALVGRFPRPGGVRAERRAEVVHGPVRQLGPLPDPLQRLVRRHGVRGATAREDVLALARQRAHRLDYVSRLAGQRDQMGALALEGDCRDVPYVGVVDVRPAERTHTTRPVAR